MSQDPAPRLGEPRASVPACRGPCQAVDIYLRAWCETNRARRDRLLAQALDTQARYCDPMTALAGRQALSDHIERILALRPGARIVRCGPLDVHHQLGRFGWQVIGADGAPMRRGIGFAEFDALSHRLLRVADFPGEAGFGEPR